MSFADRVRRLHDYAWLILLLASTWGRADGELRADVRTWAGRLCGELADAYDVADRSSRARYFARQAELWDPHGPPRPPARAAAMARPNVHSVIDARGRWTRKGSGPGTAAGASLYPDAPTTA